VRGWEATPFSPYASQTLYGLGSWDTRAYGISGRVGRAGVALHFGRLKHEIPHEPDTRESMLLLGFGVDLVEVIRGTPAPRVQWGIGLGLRRNAMHVPGAHDPEWKAFDAWDLDLGTLVRLERPLVGLPVLPIAATEAEASPSFVVGRFGLDLRNALNRKIGPNDSPMGKEIRAGLGVESGLVATPPFGHLVRALVTFEIEDSFTEKHVRRNLKYGVETTLLGILSWRYGEFDDHYILYIGSGSPPEIREEMRNLRGVTHGLGLRLGGDRLSASFDYARTVRASTVNPKLYTLALRWVP
jgi:hypothetical protein